MPPPPSVWLFGFAYAVGLVGLLEDEEGLLSFALFREKTFAVEAILNFRQDAAGRPEVHEDPWTHTAKLRDVVEHD